MPSLALAIVASYGLITGVVLHLNRDEPTFGQLRRRFVIGIVPIAAVSYGILLIYDYGFRKDMESLEARQKVFQGCLSQAISKMKTCEEKGSGHAECNEAFHRDSASCGPLPTIELK